MKFVECLTVVVLGIQHRFFYSNSLGIVIMGDLHFCKILVVNSASIKTHIYWILSIQFLLLISGCCEVCCVFILAKGSIFP